MAKRRDRSISNDQQHLQVMHEFQTLSALTARMRMASQLGLSYSGYRDIYKAFGYKKKLEFVDYLALYERGDIAAKVVEAAPNASWRIPPSIEEDKDETTETDFEAAWSQLQRGLNVFHHLHKADIISGIGQYGILLMGFDDGQELDIPIQPDSNRNLVYLQSYKEDMASVSTVDNNPTSPRYGLPETYDVRIGVVLPYGISPSQKSVKVHHSRVIHIAEGTVDNRIYGTPRMKKCFNRLSNVELVAGSATEMWYRGAFPGFNFKMDPDAQVSTGDLNTMKDQIEEYMHDFKRYLRLQGVSVESIAPQVSDSRPTADILFKLISASTGIPARILFGSERGELASSQDEKNWLDKIIFRRTDFCESFILRPFIDRLMEVGTLPKVSQYSVRWPELINSSELDQASSMERKTKALVHYADSLGAQGIYPPEMFFSKFLKMDAEDIKQIIKKVDQYIEDEQRRMEEDRELLRRQSEQRGQGGEAE